MRVGADSPGDGASTEPKCNCPERTVYRRRKPCYHQDRRQYDHSGEMSNAGLSDHAAPRMPQVSAAG